MKKTLIVIFCCLIGVYGAEISCEKLQDGMSVDVENFNINLLECDGSAMRVDGMQELFDIARQIRSERISCVGNIKFQKSLATLGVKILQASYKPYEYAKTLKSPDEMDLIRQKDRAYFRYWGHHAFYNFNKFKEFWNAFNKVQTPLAKFYEAKGHESVEAGYFATALLYEILHHAVGSNKMSVDITDEQKQINDINNVEEILTLLYSKDYNPYELNTLLKTALLYEKDTEILREILKRGASINEGDENAIIYALKNIKNVKFLINSGANVNYKNSFGKTALFYAVELKDANLVKILLENGANPNEKYIDNHSKSAILGLGANLPFYINLCAFERTKRSVFMHAGANSTPEILQLLLDYGVDVDELDELGLNAYDYALANNNTEVLEFLQVLGLNREIGEYNER
ncbi:hypothetical protein LMG7974_01175 [Campylobacter majalis]|uniref:Ankyrin repeat domain-containing protein n=1 Tax=Campylobacter majalis TaxID=2790656 RepID=A0ABM8Q7H3_9BACT|nr:ankyrin repeat domain-containing protein [Campylobacter majalis]CAD7288832.1 hypothetical protein LMG7974_01175 [Campylobacter majalis]